MTDNEIVQELLQIGYGGYWCINCRYARTRDRERCNLEDCNITRNALDLIKRQNAEIERLQKKVNTQFATITFDRDKLQEIVDECAKNIKIDINLVKSEAVREFSDRLKEKAYPFPCAIGVENAVTIRTIDDLLKEMVGEDN